ncbi:MAG: hypothetical protein EHM58_17865 [Ignavibacteriae bacterium]|nr:MAG: hypothetical protein EHM58_17865 [Ignavibacteriota bacterium]
MKKIIFTITVLLISAFYCSNLYAQEDTTKWEYFKINVTTSDDSLFIKLQEDMGIDPLLPAYTIYVDVRKTDLKNKFIVLGDINDESSMKFAWNRFREEVQKGLLNWKKPNKIKIE